VRHEKSGNGEIPTQRIERLLEIGARDCVERTEGLIQQDDAWSRRNASSQSHALTLAARQFMREPRTKRPRGKSHELQCVPRRIVSVAHLLERRNEGDISQYSPVGQEATVLLDVAHLSSQRNRRLGTNIRIADSHFAALRLHESIEAAQQCGFAGPTLSDQRDRFARRNVDVDIIERDHAPESVGDIPRS